MTTRTMQAHCIRKGNVVDGKVVKTTYNRGTAQMGEYEQVINFADGTFAIYGTGEMIAIATTY